MDALAKIPSVAWWAAAFVIVVLFFQRPICDVIRRIGTLKVKSPRLDLEVGPPPRDSSVSTVMPTQTVEPPVETPAVEDKKGNDIKTLDVLERLWAAFEARDLGAMALLRNEFREIGKDDNEKASNDELYLELRSEAGDPQAIRELRRLGNSGPRAAQTRLRLADTLARVGQPGQAKDAYGDALAVAATESQRAEATIGLTREIEKSGQWEEATRMLVDALGSVSDTAARVELLNALATTAKQHEQNFLTVIALEESLALNPGDTSKLFDLGYSADEASFSGVSITAYRQLLKIAPKHAGGLNNLGVTYQKMGLPAMAVELYEQSSGLGNTLADANLAQMLINAGFLSVARSRLTAASAAKDAHDNVHSALVRIGEKQKEEKQKLLDLSKCTRESVDRLITFGHCLFSAHVVGQIEGTWSEPEGSAVQLRVVDGHIMGQCSADKHQWALDGHADFAAGGRIEAIQTDGYTKQHLNGYVCLELDGSALQFVLSNSKGELVFWRFTKVPPTTA